MRSPVFRASIRLPRTPNSQNREPDRSPAPFVTDTGSLTEPETGAPSGPDYDFVALIGEFMLFDGALSAEEVRSLATYYGI